MTYYHVTYCRNRDSIREHGLRPHVWVWDDYISAVTVACAPQWPMDIWHIDPADFVWVPHAHPNPHHQGAWATAEVVTPNHLIRVEEVS